VRAIVNCRLGIPPETLPAILKELLLLPEVPQDDPIVVAEKQKILDDISKEESDYVRATFKLTVVEKDTRTWGIVSGDQQIELRLLNHNPERLRRAVESIVTRLSDYSDFKKLRTHWWNRLAAFLGRLAVPSTVKKLPPPDAFDFVPPVEVREAQRDLHSFSGKIRSQRTLGTFLRVRRREQHLVVVSLVIAILGFVATVPPIAVLWLGHLDPVWSKYLDGHVERLTTASALVCIVWIIELYVGWSEHRRRRVVEWLQD